MLSQSGHKPFVPKLVLSKVLLCQRAQEQVVLYSSSPLFVGLGIFGTFPR